MQPHFTETFGTLYYRRQVTPEQGEHILQTHAEGTSLRGTSRVNQRAYGTVVSLIHAASQKAQLVHDQEVRDVAFEQVAADEMWSQSRPASSELPASLAPLLA